MEVETDEGNQIQHDPTTKKNFEEGQFIHIFMGYFLKWLWKKGKIDILSMEKERTFGMFGREWFLDGKHDALVREKDTGIVFIYDFKSIKSLKRYKEEGSKELVDVELPKQDHVEQINLYMLAQKIFQSKLIYIDKMSFSNKFNTKEIIIKEILVKYDEKLIAEKIQQIDEVYDTVKHKKLPGRIDEGMKSVDCMYCSFKDECAKNENPLAESTVIDFFKGG
jgi:hypothetical protein